MTGRTGDEDRVNGNSMGGVGGVGDFEGFWEPGLDGPGDDGGEAGKTGPGTLGSEINL